MCNWSRRRFATQPCWPPVAGRAGRRRRRGRPGPRFAPLRRYRPTPPGEQSHTVVVSNLANRVQSVRPTEKARASSASELNPTDTEQGVLESRELPSGRPHEVLEVLLGGGMLQHVGHPAGWGMVTAPNSPVRRGVGVVGGVVGGVALSRVLRRDAPLPSPSTGGRSGGAPSPSGGSGAPTPPPIGSGSPTSSPARAGNGQAAARGAGTNGAGAAGAGKLGPAAGAAGTVAAGAVLAGMAAKRGADKHRDRVGHQLAGELDSAPTWPESNRSGQPLPLPVILDRQHQRRAYRDWHQRNGSDSPDVPRRKDGDE